MEQRILMPSYLRQCFMVFLLLAAIVPMEYLFAQSRDQLEILKDMPEDQRDALMRQILGDDSGVDVRNRTLEFPKTVLPRTREELERQRRNEDMFGQPRFQGGDTLLLRLEIREFTGPDDPPVPKQVPLPT